MLTLLIVPSSFSLALGVERGIGSRLSRRLLSYRPGDEHAPAIDHPTRPALARGPGRIGYDDPGSAPAE